MKFSAAIVLAIMLVALTISRPVLAQDRFALVVGIDRYAKLAPLEKAGNDAQAIGGVLTRLGFQVEQALDVDRRALNRAISDLVSRITPGSIVYFHYSGHGVSIDNDTYLLPADMDVPGPRDREFVKREAIRLSELIDSLKNAKARARVMVIDACRDNPFTQSGVRSIGTGRGITLLPAPEGTLILYSAADGQKALDKLGPSDTERTSVYTRTLLKQMTIPGQSMVTAAREVRREVEQLARSVGHEQRPAYYDELSEDLKLSGPTATIDPAPEISSPAPQPMPSVRDPTPKPAPSIAPDTQKPADRWANCPADVFKAGQDIWPAGSIRTGQRKTAQHPCGRRVTCIGGTLGGGRQRTCNWN